MSAWPWCRRVRRTRPRTARRDRLGRGAGGGGAAGPRAASGGRLPARGEEPCLSHFEPLWRPAYVGIGSNLNQPAERVREACARLSALPVVSSLQRSRLYSSAPMGPQDQPQFVNAAAGFVTQLGARQLLDELLGIERAMGRHRAIRWGPRIIDLDLLWMPGAATDEPDLTVPHPGVSMRNFVLYPLADIAPALNIPGLGNMQGLLRGVGSQGIAVLDEESV